MSSAILGCKADEKENLCESVGETDGAECSMLHGLGHSHALRAVATSVLVVPGDRGAECAAPLLCGEQARVVKHKALVDVAKRARL